MIYICLNRGEPSTFLYDINGNVVEIDDAGEEPVAGRFSLYYVDIEAFWILRSPSLKLWTPRVSAEIFPHSAESKAGHVKMGLRLMPGEQRKATKRLCDYYGKPGFKRVPRTPFMVMAPDAPKYDCPPAELLGE